MLVQGKCLTTICQENKSSGVRTASEIDYTRTQTQWNQQSSHKMLPLWFW